MEPTKKPITEQDTHDRIQTADSLGVKRSCFEDPGRLNFEDSKPIYTEVFKTFEKQEVYLHLFSNMLVKSTERNISTQKDSAIQVLKFSFDVAFYIKRGEEAAKKYSAIKFVNLSNKLSETFYTMSMKTINCWANLLSNYTNQIGINEYYKTIKALGKGVSAEVYLTERLSDGKLFAVKVFNKTKNNKKCQEAFQNEIKILRLLNHPNIMKLYSVFISSEYIFAIVEYLSGGTLFDEVKANQEQKQRYPKNQQLKIAHDLISGIQHLRIKRIVHRDIKLENILIRPATATQEKGYVICDFGLATWIDEDIYIFQKCGTPGYIAPEILCAAKNKSVKVDCKVDVFSLGCILHVVILCRTVFHYNGDCKALIKLNKQCEIDFQAKRYQSLSPEQLIILKLMLEKDPVKRCGSDELLTLSYFRDFKTEPRPTSKPKTQRANIHSEMALAPKSILRSTDRMSSVQVKQQKKSAFTRNASLNKNISFTEPSQKAGGFSSIFDFFSKKKVSNSGGQETKAKLQQQIKLKMKQPVNVKREIVKDMISDL